MNFYDEQSHNGTVPVPDKGCKLSPSDQKYFTFFFWKGEGRDFKSPYLK